MTRAGEKLYREDEDLNGSLVWALVTHPEFRRGFSDVARVLGTVLILLFVGLL